MQKPKLVTDEIYHLYNRGVEKREIFLDKQDHFRFINCLAEFNDTNFALPSNIRYLLRNPSQADSRCLEDCLGVQLLNNGRIKSPLVDILAFCLMPNHYHLLVRQLADKGISRFMQKLGTGYTNYFNLKNKRVGSLFQGRFKAVLADKEDHFRYLTLYIHLNPLDIVTPEWRVGKVKDTAKALGFLKDYRWSSYHDYIGKNNFPLVTRRDFISSIFDGPKNFKEYTENFINTPDCKSREDLILE